MKASVFVTAFLFAFSQAVFSANATSATGAAPTGAAPDKSNPGRSQGPSKPATSSLAANYGKLPLRFEANHGQSDPQVKFLSRGSGYSLFLTDSAAVLALTKGTASSKRGFDRSSTAGKKPGPSAGAAKTDVVRMELAGASRGLQLTGAEQLPGTANYFIGNDPKKWHSNVPTYAKVKYTGVYPGIDLIYYGNQRQLEYDFIVAPGADAKRVRLHFAGAKKLKLESNGDLDVIANDGEIAFHKPIVYQIKDGRRQEVDGRFTLHTGNRVGFSVGYYDQTSQLVIDPILEYSTYLGGSAGDYGSGIAVDTAGNAYVTGGAGSTDFPVTSGAFQTVNPKGGAFVAKLNSTGTALIYATYLGGSTAFSYGSSIAVDSAGDAYVTGATYASDFPVTPGAFQTVNKGGVASKTGPPYTPNAFITKLNPAGSGLVYSTYLGGSGSTTIEGGDYGGFIALDGAGDAYVAGYTYSTNFPTTSGAFQTANNAAANSENNAFVTKLNPAGTGLVYSTYLGGSASKQVSGGDFAWGVAIDTGGNAYVTGFTYSSDFPVTSGAFQTTSHSGNSDSAYATKLNPTGTALVYSTYLGGSSYNSGWGIAIDAGGSAYVVGETGSTDFPVTSGAFQSANNGAANNEGVVFVTKLNPAGTSLVYSTYLGGSGGDTGYAVAIDSNGNAYLTGDSYSTDFPVTSDAFQPVNNGATPQLEDDNAFVTEINSTGTALLYSTYLGGSSEGGEYGNGIAVDSSGNAYVTGTAASNDFPVTNGAFQVVNNSKYEETGFVAKFSLAASSTLTPTATSVASSANPQSQGANVTFTAYVTPTTGGGIPTGTVGFSFAGAAPTSAVLDTTGHASYSTTTLPDGVRTLVVTYSGDTNYSPSNGALTQTILGPPAIISADGSGQTAQVGSVFTSPLLAYVADSAGDPLSGVVVNFSGTGLDFSPSSATTGSYGEASVAATPTAIGTLTATVTVSGTTVQANYSLTGTAPSGLQFVAVTPCRVADTRNPAGPFGGPEPTAGSTTTFYIPQSACGIPYGAAAYSLNVTVVPNASLNYLTLWPTGEAQPFVSTLNSDGRVKANAAITPAGVYGGVSVFVSDATQVILDIDGYFIPAGTADGLAFYPVTPCRIADTRNPAGPLGGPFIAAGGTRAFPVLSSSCNLPATAQAYSLNVTAVPHTTLNYLTIWPTGETQPYVSTLNSSTGAVTANAAIVPAGSGDVSVFVYDDADVILDVNGYFAPPVSGGLSLYTATPCRVIDTRPVPFTGTTVVSVQGSACAPPSTAEAYVLNATVLPDGALNYLTLWPAGASQPYVSTLNADDGTITSNMAIVPTNNGAVDAYADGATNLILDFSGYFAP
jgi:Bacterial Ig-like domain (group 3)/Beta-propeller repeat